MTEFESLFNKSDGIDAIMTFAATVKSNDDNEKKWIAKARFSKRKKTLETEPEPEPDPEPEPELEVTVDFTGISGTGNDPIDIFHFGNTFATGTPIQPGLVTLDRGESNIGWQEFTNLRFASGGTPGSIPYPGPAFNLISFEYAPGNHDGATVNVKGFDANDSEVYSIDVSGVDTSTVTTFNLNWIGIFSVTINVTDVGALNPGANGPVPAHFYHGIKNIKYTLT